MCRQLAGRFALFAFATYGALWTVIESVGAFIDQLKPTGALAYGTLIAVSVAVGAWKAWPTRRVELSVAGTDSRISVEFGDLFTKQGCVAIQVNEYFDSLIGDHVSLNSLHGKFISGVLGGQSSSFDALVSAALAGVPHDIVQRATGNTRRYKIGTTASVEGNSPTTAVVDGPTRFE